MCVAAITALGSAATPFVASLGLNLASGLAQRSAAQSAAEQQYQSALITNRSAEQAFANQQEATAAQLKETRASSAQEKLAKTIQGLQARGSIRASEQAGLTVNLLLADAERQTANARESINQTLESVSRQYTRSIRGLESQRDDRRNQLQSNINQAYNQIPSLGSVILNTAAQGLSSYAQLTAS
tara:strand:- start:490 stop:1044 length:555 start_codon:yes stop_codon:yes gene_type:complete